MPVADQSEHWNIELLQEEEITAHLDIVVITRQGLEDLTSIRGLPQDLRSRRHTIQSRNKALKSPVTSPSAGGNKPQKHFTDKRLVAGRPLHRYSVPTAVYSQELAKIMEQFDKIEEVEVTEKIVRHAADLVSVGADLFEDEKQRKTSSENSWM
ncbi:hypothetical protein E1B28_003066 [Marasmius oreades]|uniref:Uncharacterized protein n=1 Tax=Marasmius oreades TaxID=181124 RepID=A0A9P7UK83_9AGAR|nr:uncharacterized protein E1B28_003066 [Marasmius oreades]KAG7085505.1 hypothetical protein E1B28_003066 [Marasmius oreades]